jgi:hypothetical protein
MSAQGMQLTPTRPVRKFVCAVVFVDNTTAQLAINAPSSIAAAAQLLALMASDGKHIVAWSGKEVAESPIILPNHRILPKI